MEPKLNSIIKLEQGARQFKESLKVGLLRLKWSLPNVTELRDSIKTPKLFNQTSDFKLEKLSLFIYSFKEISACLAAGYELCKI